LSGIVKIKQRYVNSSGFRIYLQTIRPNEKKGVKNATKRSVKKETTPLKSL
jgi:hypothetical protein